MDFATRSSQAPPGKGSILAHANHWPPYTTSHRTESLLISKVRMFSFNSFATPTFTHDLFHVTSHHVSYVQNLLLEVHGANRPSMAPYRSSSLPYRIFFFTCLLFVDYRRTSLQIRSMMILTSSHLCFSHSH